jgi:hypothetical protein
MIFGKFFNRPFDNAVHPIAPAAKLGWRLPERVLSMVMSIIPGE